ncbi:class A sortase [Listeria aquatica]|uniref:Extracellular protein n=1 Tax=Listeria aquatica FSL S10-1188 TaxID=1265818 RepID=W7B1M8_9LIST|nr:class A sortase [Listeria aquatica]EUJ16601.1 extracellular protein [Listeria aquatica FSL S10-1188]
MALFVTGISIFWSQHQNQVQENAAKHLTQSAEQVKKNSKKNQAQQMKNPNKVKPTPYDESDQVERLSWQDYLDFQNSADEKKILQQYAVGTIEIPSISLTLPIIEATTNSHLKAGATTFWKDQSLSKGNYVLLGHNMGRKGILFSDVPHLKKGNHIKIRTGAKLFTYHVTEIKKVNQKQTDVLEQSEKRQLTLITCDKRTSTENRIVIVAEPIH